MGYFETRLLIGAVFVLLFLGLAVLDAAIHNASVRRERERRANAMAEHKRRLDAYRAARGLPPLPH